MMSCEWPEEVNVEDLVIPISSCFSAAGAIVILVSFLRRRPQSVFHITRTAFQLSMTALVALLTLQVALATTAAQILHPRRTLDPNSHNNNDSHSHSDPESSLRRSHIGIAVSASILLLLCTAIALVAIYGNGDIPRGKIRSATWCAACATAFMTIIHIVVVSVLNNASDDVWAHCAPDNLAAGARCCVAEDRIARDDSRGWAFVDTQRGICIAFSPVLVVACALFAVSRCGPRQRIPRSQVPHRSPLECGALAPLPPLRRIQSVKTPFGSARDPCAVCLATFDDPRKLRCGHVFCARCIDGVVAGAISGQVCPTCRAPIDISEGRSARDVLMKPLFFRSTRQAKKSETATPAALESASSDRSARGSPIVGAIRAALESSSGRGSPIIGAIRAALESSGSRGSPIRAFESSSSSSSLASSLSSSDGSSSRRSSSARGVAHSCAVCLGTEIASAQMGQPCESCAFRSCTDCLRRHVQSRLDEGALPQCPGERCSAPLPHHIVKTALGGTAAALLSFERALDLELQGTSGITFCVWPDCPGAADLGAANEASATTHFVCPVSHDHQFCTACTALGYPSDGGFHGGWTHLTCDGFRGMFEADEDGHVGEGGRRTGVWRLLQRGAVQLCPSCGAGIERNGGCPNMTCRCGHRFRWTGNLAV